MRIYTSWNENYYNWIQENRYWPNVYDEDSGSARNPEEIGLMPYQLNENIKLLKEQLLQNLEIEKQKYENLFKKQKLKEHFNKLKTLCSNNNNKKEQFYIYIKNNNLTKEDIYALRKQLSEHKINV